MRRIHPLLIGGAIAVAASLAILAPSFAAGLPLTPTGLYGTDAGTHSDAPRDHANGNGNNGNGNGNGNDPGPKDNTRNGNGNGNNGNGNGNNGNGNGNQKHSDPSTPPGDPNTDTDGDGISDAADVCPDTDLGGGSSEAPAGTEPNHFWWTGTELTNGTKSYTLEQTAGCTVADIIAVAHLGNGQVEAGLAPGQVKRWVRAHS